MVSRSRNELFLTSFFQTRTSSPIQIPRNSDTYESTSLRGLYPIGEGAGYAGGIVSAAVDGMYAGFAVAKSLGLYSGDIESILGKAQYGGWAKYWETLWLLLLKKWLHEVKNKHDQFKEPRKIPVWASISTCNSFRGPVSLTYTLHYFPNKNPEM